MPLIATAAAIATLLLIGLLLQWRSQHVQAQQLYMLQNQLGELQQQLLQQLHQGQLNGLQQLHNSLNDGLQRTRDNVIQEMRLHRDDVAKTLDKLSGQVEQRLSEGFEKTTKTFADITKRLTIIDQAQQKITELSSDVVSLQSILSDKRSRGAFGEVQLSALVRNIIPENHLAFQHQLSNGRRADCILFLPDPTGNVVIDAKFPLETYQKLMDVESPSDKKRYEQQFRVDIKKHINDIAERYIIPGETADGAVMFIPAEAIFADIHSHYPELVTYAQNQKVWLVSPTTMMAVLTTARAVLKDDATRKQIHVIQEHLRFLSKDFERFQKRMDNLARHIKQAHDDVSDVNVSAKKITARFDKIEQVECDSSEASDLI